MITLSTHRKSAWLAAGLLVTLSLIVASSAAFAQAPRASAQASPTPASQTATNPSPSSAATTGTTPQPSTAPTNAPQVSPQPSTAPTAPGANPGVVNRRVQTEVSSSGVVRKVDPSQPETARDEQVMVPETATDNPPPRR